MSKRCEKCGDSFLCAEHAQVQCGLSCPPDWPGHWRDWHSEDHNCATKGRAAAAKRESTGGTTTELIDALRERLAAAERERDEAREALREHSDVLHDLVNIINGLDIRMSRRDSDAMSATLLLAERLLEEHHEDED